MNNNCRVVMLLENDLYPQDVRVRDEAHALRDAGYDVSVIAPRGSGQKRRELLDGVSVERYWTPREVGNGAFAILIEYLLAHPQLFARGARALLTGADVIHLHNPPDTLFPIGLLARLLRRRVVYDQHDLFPELFAEKFGNSVFVSGIRFLQWASARSAHVTLTTNESQRAAVARRRGMRPGQVVIVRNAPPAAALTTASKLRPGPLEDPELLYVGALEPQDGVQHLPGLVARLPGVRLTVIGWGTLLESMRAEARELGLEKRLTFTGRLPHDRVLELIAESDICLDVAPCSPLNHRTTMVKIAEYMALGKPVVSFALEETIRTARDAFVCVPCGDWEAYVSAIAELVADQARRESLGKKARARAKHLTWPQSASALIDAYAQHVCRPERHR